MAKIGPRIYVLKCLMSKFYKKFQKKVSKIADEKLPGTS